MLCQLWNLDYMGSTDVYKRQGIRRDVMEAALFEALQGQIKISAHIMAGMGI